MQAPNAGGPPDSDPGPDANAAPDSGPPADAGPGDAPDPGDAAGDAPGELSFSELERDSEGEQEFVLTGPCSVEARTQPKVPLTPDLTGLPEEPGVYVIYVNDAPWYVGVAEEGIRKRFLHRLKVLRDLGLPSTLLQGRSVEPIPLIRATVGSQALSRRSAGKSPSPLPGKHAILKVLEQLYIRKMRTAHGKGNRNRERVFIDPQGSLSVQVDGKPLQVPLRPHKSKSGQVIGQVF